MGYYGRKGDPVSSLSQVVRARLPRDNDVCVDSRGRGEGSGHWVQRETLDIA